MTAQLVEQLTDDLEFEGFNQAIAFPRQEINKTLKFDTILDNYDSSIGRTID